MKNGTPEAALAGTVAKTTECQNIPLCKLSSISAFELLAQTKMHFRGPLLCLAGSIDLILSLKWMSVRKVSSAKNW